MPLLLVVLFIVVPIAELALLIQIGQLIGVWWTIALLVVDAVLGSLLARSQGRTVWRRFNEALRSGRPPAREVMDGALVLFGGALLVRRFAGRMVASMTAPREPGPPRPRQGYDVEGTAVDSDPEALDPR